MRDTQWSQGRWRRWSRGVRGGATCGRGARADQVSEGLQGFRGVSRPPGDPGACVPEKAGTREPGAGPVRSEGGSGKQRVLGTLPGALGVVWGRVVETGSPAGGDRGGT